MSGNVRELGSGGLVEVESTTGPGSYDATNGIEITSDLGRVDQGSVQIASEAYEARIADVTDNVVTVRVYNQDGTGEIADTTDLSGTEITHQAYRL